MRDPSCNRQLYQCNDCNGCFTTLQSLCDNMLSRIGSVELWNVKVVKPTGSYWGDDACVVWGHSPVDSLIVINLAAEKSFTSVNMLIHTGERPFSCSVCNYQRRQDCDLKQHMRRHKYTPQKIAKKILPNFVVIVAKFCDTKLPKFAKIFWYVSAFRYVLYCRFSWFVQWFYMAQKLQTPKSQQCQHITVMCVLQTRLQIDADRIFLDE